MARLSMKGPGTVAEITAILKEKIPECGLICELTDSVSRGGTELLIYEKHYYRAGNYLTLSILVSSENGLVTVDSIASGAREGVLFDVTWGAEEDFAMEVNAVLAPLGFTVFDKSGEFDREMGIPGFFTAEPTEEPLSMGDIMQRARGAVRKENSGSETAEYMEIKDEPERVKLGREEKKGLFGRKRRKPDWEY